MRCAREIPIRALRGHNSRVATASVPTTVLIFDSGLGGLTVFREVAQARPHARYVYIADDAYFETLKVERLIGTRVSRVDPHAKNVTLSDGQNLPFDNRFRSLARNSVGVPAQYVAAPWPI